MRVVIQRVNHASVTIDEKKVSNIYKGLLVFVGFEATDSDEDLEWVAGKIVRLRVFDDNAGIMNLSVQEISGDVLIVSQFTLHAKTKKGNRPSYIQAAPPEVSIPLYNQFVQILKAELPGKISTGEFGAMMKISLENDGPVTIIIDSKKRE